MSDIKNEFPLYPELSEQGNIEAVKLIEKFKKDLVKAADEAIGDLYCEIIPHIESDSWSNFRNNLMDGFKNYDNRLLQSPRDFKEIRQQIFNDFKADIIPDLNQDLVEENERLKADIERMEEWERERSRY